MKCTARPVLNGVLQETKSDGATKYLCHVFRAESAARAYDVVTSVHRATVLCGTPALLPSLPPRPADQHVPKRESIFNCEAPVIIQNTLQLLMLLQASRLLNTRQIGCRWSKT